MLKSSELGEEAIQSIYKMAMEWLPVGHSMQAVLESQARGLQTSYSIIAGLLKQPQHTQKIAKSV
jgi:hypothetical protein